MTTISRAPSPPAAPGPERSARRDLAHLALLTVPWAFFGWLWWRVALTTTAQQLLGAAGWVLLAAAICLPVTLLWIRHNLQIFRRKGPRTGRSTTPIDYGTDWTRRPVVADWVAVRAASVVTIEPGPDRKTFHPDSQAVVAVTEEDPDDRVGAAAGR